MVKLSHLANQGLASRALDPRLKTYYGKAEEEMQKLESELEPGAKPDLKKFIGVTPDEPIDVEAECSTSIHCSRPEAGSSHSVCDILGLVGAVCAVTPALPSDAITP